MTNILRKLTQAMTLLVVGAAAYFVAPVAIRLARPAPTPKADPPPVAAISDPAAPADSAGDPLLVRCLVALERRGQIEAELVQAGYLADQRVEIAGVYRQAGRGDTRRFSTLLQGRIGSGPARLWQVSDGRFLWTDVSWGEADHRNVTRVDLRRLRTDLITPTDAGTVSPDQATAASVDPAAWAGFGGLPTLLESLRVSFHFGAPRRMALHNQPVFVMVGHWRPEAHEGTPPADAPHHVLLALNAADLFPLLVEYRSQSDPLAADGLSDDELLRESRRPQLRMEFRRPRFDRRFAAAEFQYPTDDALEWTDVTERRLESLRNRHTLRIAAQQRRPFVGVGR